ncbi:MAG: metal-sulfur cluster assembly factor [Flavobacteriales bacterium]|nr:metal-sulfur cluster assembly factor [Flavobacteriales bacterium]
MDSELSDKELELFNALKGVIDPELMVNIVDLGLVYDVRIDETQKTVEIDMTLTSPSCPLGDVITEDVEHVAKNMFDDFAVKVSLIWDPYWTLERITDKGREALDRR